MCICSWHFLTFECICQTAIRKAVQQTYCYCRHTSPSMQMPAAARSSSKFLFSQCIPVSGCNPVDALIVNPRERLPQGLEVCKLVRYFPFILPLVNVQILSIATHINQLPGLTCCVCSRLDISKPRECINPFCPSSSRRRRQC